MLSCDHGGKKSHWLYGGNADTKITAFRVVHNDINLAVMRINEHIFGILHIVIPNSVFRDCPSVCRCEHWGSFEARARSQQFFTFTALVVCHLSWTAAPSLLSVSRQQFTSFFLVKDVNTSYSCRDNCRLCETLTPSKCTVAALLPVRMSLCYISCVITFTQCDHDRVLWYGHLSAFSSAL